MRRFKPGYPEACSRSDRIVVPFARGTFARGMVVVLVPYLSLVRTQLPEGRMQPARMFGAQGTVTMTFALFEPLRRVVPRYSARKAYVPTVGGK